MQSVADQRLAVRLIAERPARSVLLAFLVVIALAIAGLTGVNAVRALNVVHPRRAPVDEAAVKSALPDSVHVTFQGIDGVTLVGDYVAPKNGAAIVLVHGLFGNRAELLPEAQLLAAQGYGVLIYDNRAHGDSGGSTATWGQLESYDAEKAVDFVEQTAGVPAGDIGLLGFSIGGTAVLREAATDQRVGAVVVEATYSSMRGEIEHMYSRYGPLSELPARLVAQLVGHLDYSQLEPVQLVCGLGSRPLLLVYGSEDPDVPIEQAQRMTEAACRPEQMLVLHADTHGEYMQSPDAGMYSAKLLRFFDSHLPGSA